MQWISLGRSRRRPVGALLVVRVWRRTPPRLAVLLEDLLAHTDAAHADEAPLRESLARVCDVAMHINEEKRHLDDVEKFKLEDPGVLHLEPLHNAFYVSQELLFARRQLAVSLACLLAFRCALVLRHAT